MNLFLALNSSLTDHFLGNNSENLQFPELLRKSAPPQCCSFQEKRKSATISENLIKTANLAPFVPFSLSLLVPPDQLT